MALRSPILTEPASCNFGTAAAVSGTASMVDTDLMALPQLINAGASFDTDPLLVAGFNSFGIVVSFGGAGPLTILYNILDPRSFAVQFTRSVAAGIATNSYQVFGAFAAVGAADPFLIISLRFTAGAGALTVNNVRFLMAAR